jgi:hypothetical protein
MTQRRLGALSSAILLAVTNGPTASTETMESLRACVNEADDVRRLECYDREMARQAASTSNAQASNATPAPRPPLTPEERFGLNDDQAHMQEHTDDPPAIDRLTATISALSHRAQGELVMTLSNGQVWAQKQASSFEVKVGDAVTIKSAALGSFLMSTASGRSTRVTRLR